MAVLEAELEQAEVDQVEVEDDAVELVAVLEAEVDLADFYSI